MSDRAPQGEQTSTVDHMRESRIARARGLAQAIAECRDDAPLDGIREGAAEIVTLLGGSADLHRIAREVTDEVMGPGTYDHINHQEGR